MFPSCNVFVALPAITCCSTSWLVGRARDHGDSPLESVADYLTCLVDALPQDVAEWHVVWSSTCVQARGSIFGGRWSSWCSKNTWQATSLPSKVLLVWTVQRSLDSKRNAKNKDMEGLTGRFRGTRVASDTRKYVAKIFLSFPASSEESLGSTTNR